MFAALTLFAPSAVDPRFARMTGRAYCFSTTAVRSGARGIPLSYTGSALKGGMGVLHLDYTMMKKKEDIIKAAKELFFQYGIQKTTVEEVCKLAKVGKATFYKYFENKQELTFEVTDYLFDYTLTQFKNIMEDKQTNFQCKMNRLIQLKFDNAKDANWILIADLYKNNNTILNKHVQQWIDKGLQLAVNQFTIAQKQGNVRSDINPTLLVIILDKLYETATDARLQHAYTNLQQMTVELTKFFLYGIVNSNGDPGSSPGMTGERHTAMLQHPPNSQSLI
jgi:AcrR family transcriptional regulator